MTLNQQFDNDLKDKSSKKFNDLSKTLEEAVSDSMKTSDNDLLKTYTGLTDVSFSKGSVVSNFVMNFESTNVPNEQIKQNDVIDSFQKSLNDSTSEFKKLNVDKISVEKITSNNFPDQILTKKIPNLTTSKNVDISTVKSEITTKKSKEETTIVTIKKTKESTKNIITTSFDITPATTLPSMTEENTTVKLPSTIIQESVSNTTIQTITTMKNGFVNVSETVTVPPKISINETTQIIEQATFKNFSTDNNSTKTKNSTNPSLEITTQLFQSNPKANLTTLPITAKSNPNDTSSPATTEFPTVTIAPDGINKIISIFVNFVNFKFNVFSEIICSFELSICKLTLLPTNVNSNFTQWSYYSALEYKTATSGNLIINKIEKKL